jgi:hypothetical protein
MIELFKKLWRDVFYRTDIPFLVNDGIFGLDKCGHFARHVFFTSIGFLSSYLVCVWILNLPALLHVCIGAIAFYDFLFDINYEYGNYCKGIGFSLLDIAYGRAGCLITLWVALRWML